MSNADDSPPSVDEADDSADAGGTQDVSDGDEETSRQKTLLGLGEKLTIPRPRKKTMATTRPEVTRPEARGEDGAGGSGLPLPSLADLESAPVVDDASEAGDVEPEVGEAGEPESDEAFADEKTQIAAPRHDQDLDEASDPGEGFVDEKT